ncbi:Pescadillo like protein [Dictyocoela muelleri]|nr:Pescadillo like protein [Dictyocoela muelleri]
MRYIYNKDEKEIKLTKALQLLKINLETFKNICIMLNIKPKKTSVYTKRELNRIYNSKAYRELKRMNNIEFKRIKYVKIKRVDLAKKLPVFEHDYKDILKHRFPKFKDVIKGLGECLTALNVYLMCNYDLLSDDKDLFNENLENDKSNRKLINDKNEIKEANNDKKDVKEPNNDKNKTQNNFVDIDENIDNNIIKTKNLYSEIFKKNKASLVSSIKKEIEDFYEIVITNTWCKNVTITERGLFINFEIKSINFICLVIPISNVEVDKIERNLYFHLKHLESVNMKMKSLNNDHKKSITNNHDITNDPIKSIFKKMKFLLNCCFEREIRMLILIMGGQIINQIENIPDSEIICITENVDKYAEGLTFVYPQFIIDSFNKREKLDMTLYLVGKEYPEHYSPYKQEKIELDGDDWFFVSENKKMKIKRILENEDFCIGR